MELRHFYIDDWLVSPTPFSPSPPWRECLSTFIKHSHVSSSRSVHKSKLQWAVVLLNDRHEVEKRPAHPPKRTHKVSQFPGDQLFAEDRRNGASYRKGWRCDMRGRVGKGWSEWREIKKTLFGQAKTDITVRLGTLQENSRGFLILAKYWDRILLSWEVHIALAFIVLKNVPLDLSCLVYAEYMKWRYRSCSSHW